MRTVALLGVMAAAGCFSVPIEQGRDFDSGLVQSIVKGKTTAADCLKWFGQPTGRALVNGGDQWTYSHTGGKATSNAFTMGVQTHYQTKVLVVDLRDGIVADFNYHESIEGEPDAKTTIIPADDPHSGPPAQKSEPAPEPNSAGGYQ
jgi:hypothetical protein